MKVYALVGKSGTGKSYKALTLLREIDAKALIDDGLLIKGTKIIAGKSAKKEKSPLRAVKTAIFNDENHKKKVMKALKKLNLESILIIGTSDKMVNKIANRLEMPKIEKIIYIDEISSKEEIEEARYHRTKQGKHVIPIPSVELKRDFSGYFMDSLKIFTRNRKKEMVMTEKTVIRPAFSYLGKYTVSNKTISDIIFHVCENINGIHQHIKSKIKQRESGIEVETSCTFIYGEKIHEVSESLQEKIKADIEYMTGLNVIKIDIVAKNLYIGK